VLKGCADSEMLLEANDPLGGVSLGERNAFQKKKCRRHEEKLNKTG
jgi:hypothetical protein